MRSVRHGYFFAALACLLQVSCVPPSLDLEPSSRIRFESSAEVAKASYKDSGKKNGVVWISVNWGRAWNCGGYQNAQLTSMAFDHLPVAAAESPPDLVMNSPSRLKAEAVFVDYAYLLEAGEYALSGVAIKVAKSVSEVGYVTLDRGRLFDGEHPKGGTFSVAPGEIVYIGNFYLDCAYGPSLWRYYTPKEQFNKHRRQFKSAYPFLNAKDVRYRLFKTKVFGQ